MKIKSIVSNKKYSFIIFLDASLFFCGDYVWRITFVTFEVLKMKNLFEGPMIFFFYLFFLTQMNLIYVIFK